MRTCPGRDGKVTWLDPGSHLRPSNWELCPLWTSTVFCMVFPTSFSWIVTGKVDVSYTLHVRFWQTAFCLGKFRDLAAVLAINVKGFLCWNLVSLTRKSPTTCVGFSGGANDKEAICQCRWCKRLRFYSWVGKIPWRRAWQPSPGFLPGESYGQRSLVGYSP